MMNRWEKDETHSTLRAFCHPVDADLIRMLDNPVTRIAVGKLVELGTEVSNGQEIASAVPVTEENEPELNAILEDCVRLLRIPKPYMVLSGTEGFNACAMGNDDHPYIMLGSTLVHLMDMEQLRFVIGHECGHIAMGHMVYHNAANLLALFAQRLPAIGTIAQSTAGLALNAWSRRSEITADRAGMLCCGSARTAIKALMQIESMFVSASNINTEAYMQESRTYREGSLLRRIGEFGANHPMTSKRMECIQLFEQSSLLFRLCGEEAPEGSLSDRDLKNRVEAVLRVI